MRSLTVEARSLDSARGLCAALASFQAEVTGSEAHGYSVTVELGRSDTAEAGGSDRRVIAVLDAIQAHVSTRSQEPARVELDGRHYTLRAE